MVKPALSPNQVDLVLGEKQRVIWTKQELSSALTLRYFSKRAYNYMGIDKRYFMPSISTIKRYVKQIDVKQGMLEDVIVLLGNVLKTKDAKDRECVISFDEMKVKRVVEYDTAADEIVGSFNYLQVVMARRLFSKWKQPVFICFDTKMSKAILF